MKKVSKTKIFLFNKAEYKMGDRCGNEVMLKIDFMKTEVHVEKIKIESGEIEGLISEAKLIAFDLLSRKSNNNRVDALNRKK